MNVLLAFHKIVNDALTTSVNGFITARIFQEGFTRHIQEQRAAVFDHVVYHLLNRKTEILALALKNREFIMLSVVSTFHIRDELVREIRGDVLRCRHIVERFHRRHIMRPAQDGEFLRDGVAAAAAAALSQIIPLQL